MTDGTRQALGVAFFIGVIFFVTGCFGGGIQRDTAPTAQLPVPVMPEPHEELLTCGQDAPGFKFHEHEDKDDHVVLPPSDQQRLQEWIDGKERCLDGWRSWASG